MHRSRPQVLWGPLLVVCSGAWGDVFSYVARPEPAFQWREESSRTVGTVKITDLRFTSQTWQGIEWKHVLRVFEPPEVTLPDSFVLFITGDLGGEEETLLGVTACAAIGAPFAILYQVPNQPLFGGKREDALIAHTFVKCLQTQDDTWPLLLPMTKSAVKAMDALQAFAKDTGRHVPERFVVAGASKRGWTTWLTGVVDDRVQGIAPIVYDNLNLPAQMRHQKEVFGGYSQQIDDYTVLGLQEALQTEVGRRLGSLVDPYTHVDRLRMPKLIINGTNDPYWAQDALNLYWDDLPSPKHVLYVPNRGHDVNDMVRVLGVLQAFVRTLAAGGQLPSLRWRHETADGRLGLVVASDPPARSASLWVARSATKDFRKSQWESAPMAATEGEWRGEVEPPTTGYLALFGELVFQNVGAYMLSTQIRIAPASPAR